MDTRKGSVEIQKGSAVTRKGSRDSRKLSVEMKKDPGEAQKGPGEVRRKISAQKESTGMGSKKWSSGEDRRVSIDSIRGSFESRKASFESRRSSIEGRRGSSEGRGSSSSIPSSVRPSKVPWVTLMRALGRFKLSLPNIRQYHMLAARDPLAVDTELPRAKQKAIVKRLWGDHQPLAKVRATHQGQRTQLASHHLPPLCALSWERRANPFVSFPSLLPRHPSRGTLLPHDS